VILLITVAVATLSFYLVEQPGRRIGANVRSAVPARKRWHSANLATAICGTCVLVAAFVGLLSAIGREGLAVAPIAAATPVRTATRSSPVVITLAGELPRDTTYVGTVRAWQRVIRAGLRLRELPKSLRPLSPHLSAA